MKKPLAITLIALLPIALALAATQTKKPEIAEELKPTKSQAIAADLVYQHLSGSNFSYKSLPLDDKLSTEIYAAYLKSLDDNKLFFLNSDIAAFKRYETTLDDAIKQQDFAPAFAIFKIYMQRIDERIGFARALLKQEFDFTADEQYLYDREDANWAANKAELDNIWRQSVKNDVLRLKLAGRSMAEIRTTLDKRYSAILDRTHQMKSDDVFESFMAAYSGSIDPHTGYFGPRSADNFNMSMKLSMEGIGAVLQNQDEYVVFRTIVPGSPADKSGEIKPGGRVLSVGQGESGPMLDVVGWRIDDVVAKIRGPRGSVVRLAVQAADAGADAPQKIVRIVRDKIKLEDQAASKKIINQNGKRIGVINLPAFYADWEAMRRGDADARSATSDVRKLLLELKAENVDGVLVDLRNNGGGSLPEAIELTGLFIKTGPVLQVRYSNGEIEHYDDSNESIVWTGPLGVLVNRASASASEIFAAAIQDYGRGVIIGEPTFGKGTVQTVFDLNRYPHPAEFKLGELHLTTAQFFRINGGTTQNAAVTPNVQFPVSVDASEYGESVYKNALPYTEIARADYQRLGDFKNVDAQLLELHKERVANVKEFSWWMEDVAYFKTERAKKSISLNEKVRLAERAMLKAKRDMRDAERKTLGLKTLADNDNDDDGLQSNERKVAEQIAQENAAKDLPDPLLNESAMILIDAIELLSSKPMLSKVLPAANSAKDWVQ